VTMFTAADYLLEKSRGLDKLFVAGTREQLSYRDLDAKVNVLADYLQNAHGAGKEFLLLAENSGFYIVSYLGIMKSGNTAVLVDTRISEYDLLDIRDRCSLAGHFVQEKFRSKVKADNLYTEAFLESLPEAPGRTGVSVDGDDVAVIIFTSGSTGAKKGVMLTHRNIIANTESIISYLKLTENDRMDAVLPFYYSYGASLLHTHLRVGGSLVLSNNIFLGSVIEELKRYACTGFAGVPSTFQILINRTNFLKQSFPHLRYFTQAGGSLADKYIALIVDAYPDKQFFAMYGATEATARLSYLPPHLVKEKRGSIGKGIPGVRLAVVNPDGNPVMAGEVGEVVARGDNIMKGYYKDTEATEKAIRHGWFHTGDLATVDRDGYIYITGRASNIIKSAGYRISPDEIEKVIMSLDGVAGCAVMGTGDDIMGEAVVAVVQPLLPGGEMLKKDIITLCNRKLPSYKVPRHILFMDDFPLNASNKVDRLKIKEHVKAKVGHGG
jgi:long-chain acyl-CoA synthetase